MSNFGELFFFLHYTLSIPRSQLQQNAKIMESTLTMAHKYFTLRMLICLKNWKAVSVDLIILEYFAVNFVNFESWFSLNTVWNFWQNIDHRCFKRLRLRSYVRQSSTMMLLINPYLIKIRQLPARVFAFRIARFFWRSKR